MPISMPVDADANEFLTRDALALLIAMLLDQQVPLELAAIFSERPALHRFPKA